MQTSHKHLDYRTYITWLHAHMHLIEYGNIPPAIHIQHQLCIIILLAIIPNLPHPCLPSMTVAEGHLPWKTAHEGHFPSLSPVEGPHP
jgi:hypothetical protein